jgi:hypothetical protein
MSHVDVLHLPITSRSMSSCQSWLGKQSNSADPRSLSRPQLCLPASTCGCVPCGAPQFKAAAFLDLLQRTHHVCHHDNNSDACVYTFCTSNQANTSTVFGSPNRARKLPLEISTSWWKGLGQFRPAAPQEGLWWRASACWRGNWSKSPHFRARNFDQPVEDPSTIFEIRAFGP